MKIAICDHDIDFCMCLEQHLLTIGEETSLYVEITIFNSGEQIVKTLSTSYHFDLIFLDTYPGTMSGIDVAGFIRNNCNDNETQIVFISTRTDCVLELFNTRPLNFFIKPLDYNNIKKTVILAYKLQRYNTQCFIFRSNLTFYKILIDDILYFESEGKQVKIITTQGQYSFYEQLHNVIKNLPKAAFIVIHKSYLINTHHILSSTYYTITMANQVTLPISQSHRKEIRCFLLSRSEVL